MSIKKELQSRSNNCCEICTATENLDIYTVEPATKESLKDSIYICNTCKEQIEDAEKMESNHWRCLNDSMWSEVPAVQVVAWRMLHRLKKEGWPQDLLDMLYLDEDTLEWAKATGEDIDESEKIIHKDSNGSILKAGDSVVMIKDLNVKGANFTAKRGDFMRNISLVHDNAEHIEGRVNGQHIVVLTKYVKKSK
ncbi:PhnA domain-containing protein [Aureivirga sp. CE67]|uniref:PhnA domain-containing protein n=1 Tax=Aureivirga sp. CE67 TaxID=1788983 RepID=UPI0018CAABA8|nr:alkylphosphonate utilization protein [Aureivirga sp. CE67]